MSGLERRYEVKKLSNPEKQVECIVLEFDDPIARLSIRHWAAQMCRQGYTEVYRDVMKKLSETSILNRGKNDSNS